MPLKDVLQARFVEFGLLEHLFDARHVFLPPHAGCDGDDVFGLACARGVFGWLDDGNRLHEIRPVNLRELKARLSGGFRPFSIRTTDGQQFVVPHPEFMLIGKYSVAVVDKEGYIHHLDPLHIVSAKQLSKRNGHS